MRTNNYGRIVNISSTLGSLTDIASPASPYAEIRSPAYRLSKTVINGITVMLAAELRDSDILVNSACPGWVRTDLGGSCAPLSPEQGADTPVWLATLARGGQPVGFSATGSRFHGDFYLSRRANRRQANVGPKKVRWCLQEF